MIVGSKKKAAINSIDNMAKNLSQKTEFRKSTPLVTIRCFHDVFSVEAGKLSLCDNDTNLSTSQTYCLDCWQ